MSFYELKDLSFRFSNASAFHFDHFDLSIKKGELVGFLGPNGAGKSTLLKMMAGLLKPRSGQVLLEYQELLTLSAKERAKKIAFVAQSTHFAFPLTIWEIVEMGRHPYLSRFRTMDAQDRAICERALRLCDAWEFKDRFYDQLSGGEKQRVLLASALAQTPQALLLDEPTLSLDLAHQLRLFEIIRKLHKEEGITVIVATHELNLAARFLERIVLLKNGQIEADGPSKKVLTPVRIKSVLNVDVEKHSGPSRSTYFVPKVGKK